jgi:hypothetical protein
VLASSSFWPAKIKNEISEKEKRNLFNYFCDWCVHITDRKLRQDHNRMAAVRALALFSLIAALTLATDAALCRGEVLLLRLSLRRPGTKQWCALTLRRVPLKAKLGNPNQYAVLDGFQQSELINTVPNGKAVLPPPQSSSHAHLLFARQPFLVAANHKNGRELTQVWCFASIG